MRDELLEQAQGAVAMAKSAGAADAVAMTRRNRQVDFTFRDGSLEKVQENTSRSLGVQLYVDGRYSAHRTTDLRPDRVRAFVEEAVAMTRALQPDPDRQLPDPSLYAGRSDQDLDLEDVAVGSLDRARRLAWFTEIGEHMATEDRVVSWTAGTSHNESLSAMASSNGFVGTHAETSAWMGADVTLQDEGNARPDAWYWGGGHHLDDMPGPQRIASQCLDLARARLGSVKGASQKTLMIVDPRAVSKLIGSLLRPADARAIQQGRSFWAGNQGKQLFSEHLSLWDDPLRRRGLSSRRYDSEGLAARELPLIDKGVVRNVFVDTYYGKKAGLAPTTGGRSNLRWAYGRRDLAAILADTPDAIYVTSWLGGNSDATTGDFSFGIRGHGVTKGQLGGPIGEMNVTGNLVDLFAALVEVGNDPYAYSSYYQPTLVFEGVQFSGV